DAAGDALEATEVALAGIACDTGAVDTDVGAGALGVAASLVGWGDTGFVGVGVLVDQEVAVVVGGVADLGRATGGPLAAHLAVDALEGALAAALAASAGGALPGQVALVDAAI